MYIQVLLNINFYFQICVFFIHLKDINLLFMHLISVKPLFNTLTSEDDVRFKA